MPDNKIDNDDTDIEMDDEFNEDSLVSFQPITPGSRSRKVTVIERPVVQHNRNHSKCSTLCATTYQAARDRKRAVSTVVNPIQHFQRPVNSCSDETSASEMDSSDVRSVTAHVPTRRKSKFLIKKEQEKKPIEGKWKLMGNINYEDYLSEVGE